MWALDVMMACARSAGHRAFMADIEAKQNEQLFQVMGDEVWYAHFKSFIRTRPRELTLPESWIPVDETRIRQFFEADGDGLARVFRHYEPREGQLAMAQEVAQALNHHTILLAEAGTGVGKSLAYLLPCAVWAIQNNLPIVLTTNTRNLQSQLLSKDLPLVSQCLAHANLLSRPLNAVVLKGRSNYLCLKYFGAFIEGGFERLSESEALLFADLVAWAATTTDGDLDTFRPKHTRGDMGFVRAFGCHASTCTGKACRFYSQCFLQKARQEALGADLIIANHALVFAELVNPGTLLPPHAQIVFDEAHNLENAATSALSAELSPIALYELCQKLAPSKGREAASLYQQIRTDFIDRAPNDTAERARLTDLLATLRKHGLEIAATGKALFAVLAQAFTQTPETTVRYRAVPDPTLPKTAGGQPQFRRELAIGASPFRPAETFLPEADLSRHTVAILDALGAANRLLNQFQLEIARYAPDDEQSTPYDDVLTLIKNTCDQLAEFGTGLDGLLRGDDPGRVYWMTRLPPEDHAVILTAAPLDIASQLNHLLYSHKETVIFSSATLRTHKHFMHIRKRLGLEFIEKPDRICEFIAQSPFDYPEQCCVGVPDFLPEITTGDYALHLSRLLYRLFTTAKGRCLVLFTSYELLKTCAEILEPHLKSCGIDLLAQSSTLSRDMMTEAFREQKRPTVLLGTQSFWEGVDVIGDALSCVVITRLPFETVGDPLFKARCEQLENAGRSSFAELSIPQAVIKFRQGFGRLIRSRTDKGMVVITDTRILRKQYGTFFAQALPVKVETFRTRLQLIQRFQNLLTANSIDNHV
ncbi:MAG: hypothetical protein IJV69_06270 [Kiritimatiellae bacterium]|nr:hypothetical protein [Kiritimatiellia bacterium]